MSYYQNNKEKILNKHHNLGGKEKTKEYHQNNIVISKFIRRTKRIKKAIQQK